MKREPLLSDVERALVHDKPGDWTLTLRQDPGGTFSAQLVSRGWYLEYRCSASSLSDAIGAVMLLARRGGTMRDPKPRWKGLVCERCENPVLLPMPNYRGKCVACGHEQEIRPPWVKR